MAILFAVFVALVSVVLSRRWRRAVQREPSPPEPIKPHATFTGGDRYCTADERLRVETDGPSAWGEGILMAIVEAPRARGATTNQVEPESYGYMTVVNVDGEDIVLRIGSWGREFEWTLYVESPSRKVPDMVVEAVRSLEDLRDVVWR